MTLTAKMRRAGAALGLMGALAAAGLTGCTFTIPTIAEAPVQKTAQSVDDSSLIAPGTLTVALNTSNPPQAISGDTLKGFAVDVASALADRMGLSVAFVTSSGANVQADIYIGDNAPSQEGTAAVGTYCEDATAVFGVTSENDGFDLNKLQTGTIGVQNSSASQDALTRAGVVAVQKTYSSINDCFDAMAAGEVDYVACNALSGAYLARIYNGVGFLGTVATVTQGQVYTLTQADGLHDAVTTALDGISSDGTLDAIYCKWFGNVPTTLTDTLVSGVTISSSDDDAQASDSGEMTPNETAQDTADIEAQTGAGVTIGNDINSLNSTTTE